MTEPHGFTGLGIRPELLALLQQLQFHTPTPIQEKTIPIALEGKDVIGIAQTGTGKTLAFGIPMIQRLGQHAGKGLVLLPTRELALQVDEVVQKVGRSLGLRTAVLIGGDSMHKQLQAIGRDPHVVIATPGRLNDHLEQKTIRLTNVKILVLDEADRMLDMGFAPQIKKILAHVPADRQTMLFSATMPDGIVAIAKSTMKLPLRVEVAPSGTAADKIDQEVFFVRKEEKLGMLAQLLKQYPGSVLIFTRTKHGAKRLTKQIRHLGVSVEEIHSNRSLSQRKFALEGFKRGKYRILVATDIAARGIDVKDIALVVNFDLPDSPGDYVHRIGRTGRAGKAGRAVSLAMPEQRRDVKDIERLIRMALPVAKTPAHLARPTLQEKTVTQERAPRYVPRHEETFGQHRTVSHPRRKQGFQRRGRIANR